MSRLVGDQIELPKTVALFFVLIGKIVNLNYFS